MYHKIVETSGKNRIWKVKFNVNQNEKRKQKCNGWSNLPGGRFDRDAFDLVDDQILVNVTSSNTSSLGYSQTGVDDHDAYSVHSDESAVEHTADREIEELESSDENEEQKLPEIAPKWGHDQWWQDGKLSKFSFISEEIEGHEML